MPPTLAVARSTGIPTSGGRFVLAYGPLRIPTSGRCPGNSRTHTMSTRRLPSPEVSDDERGPCTVPVRVHLDQPLSVRSHHDRARLPDGPAADRVVPHQAPGIPAADPV